MLPHDLPARRAPRLMLVVCALSFWIGGTGKAAAEDSEKPIPDKSAYHLFNPTPAKLLRELTPDRPDKTESPYTVDAGHFQVEMSLVQFTTNLSEGMRTETWNIAPANLKVGLCNNADLQLMLDNYLQVRTRELAAATRSGFGDVTLRLKMNLWGNDGGQTAFALLPFVKLPTNTNHLGNNSVEGGVIFPLVVKLPWGWEMGLETAPLVARDMNDDGYHAECINSVTFSHDLYGKLAGYAEFFSKTSTEHGSDWTGTVDVGVTYGLTENIQVDCGAYVGVTSSADDVSAFTGITARF